MQLRKRGPASTVSRILPDIVLTEVSAPHNFLKVDAAMQETLVNREWVIARITSTQEAVASGGEVSPFDP
jgi:hypothetical protein